MSVTARLSKDTFEIRETCDLDILVTSTDDLRPGDTVEAQFPNSWTIVNGPSFTRDLQTTDPSGEHYVTVEAEGCRFDVEIRKRHLYTPGKSGRHGRHIVATLAGETVPAGTPVRVLYANTFAPYVSEVETVWLRVKDEAPGAPPTLTVTPGPAETMRVIAPSAARPGETFDVLVVSLDRFENASSTRYEDRTLLLDDGSVRALGLSFSGSVRIPVSLEQEGVYRFRMGEATSNAVRVAADARGPWWGDTHIHTKVSSDAQGTDPYVYAREVSGLDFAAVADHCDSMGEAGYAQVAGWAEEGDDPGRFVTLPADERNPASWTGHHNLYFRATRALMENAVSDEDGQPIPGDPADVMLIPHHTGIGWGGGPTAGIGAAVDWDAVDDHGLRPVMEIYSHHGQSELYDPQHVLAYEFNRMRNPERRSNVSMPGPFYAQDYLMMGKRIGFIGSSDEHSGQGGRRHGGLAAVFTEELTRDGIFDALRNRQCYATTGERILVEFSVDGVTMGCEATRPKGSTLPIRLQVWGTERLLRVEVLRFRPGRDSRFTPVFSAAPRPESTDASVEIEEELEGDTIYYVRVTQEPLEWPGMAWTSPVWIDVG